MSRGGHHDIPVDHAYRLRLLGLSWIAVTATLARIYKEGWCSEAVAAATRKKYPSIRRTNHATKTD